MSKGIQNNPRQGSAEANPVQGTALSAGESSVQAMLSLVREYSNNAAFFNEVLQPLMIESIVVLPLADEPIMGFLKSFVFERILNRQDFKFKLRSAL